MTQSTDLPFDLDAKNEELEGAEPGEIIRFAWETWGPDIAMQSSFGADSACLLHLATRIIPDIRVLFLETHYHFPETLRLKQELTDRLKLNVVELEVLNGRGWFLDKYGDNLHHRNKELCCFFNKVEPMETAKKKLGLRAYLTGIRRGQSMTRQSFQILTPEPSGVIKVAPLLTWSKADVQHHIWEYDLPVHPLVQEGYPSIGCWPCTAKPVRADDERSGRWADEDKTECGLHIPPKSEDPVI